MPGKRPQRSRLKHWPTTTSRSSCVKQKTLLKVFQRIFLRISLDRKYVRKISFLNNCSLSNTVCALQGTDWFSKDRRWRLTPYSRKFLQRLDFSSPVQRLEIDIERQSDLSWMGGVMAHTDEAWLIDWLFDWECVFFHKARIDSPEIEDGD